MADNTITVVGNITRDPELRFTPAGQAVATFGLAVNRRYQQGGEWKEQTSYFDVKCWGQLGENVAASLSKGARAVVTGRLEQRTYETQAGEKRSAVEIVADEVGPSLRWATAQIEKNDRRGGDEGSRPMGGGPSRSGAGYTQDDEEPF
jgi:single-strand DNA-binding protein